jgi:hypothetical protein
MVDRNLSESAHSFVPVVRMSLEEMYHNEHEISEWLKVRMVT